MSTKPLASVTLSNGLTLVVGDRSRKVAADRWTVAINAEIRIPLDKKWIADDDEFEQITRIVGRELVFTQRRERHFVSDAQKEQITKEMCASVIELGQRYCGSDAFIVKFFRKTLSDRLKRRGAHDVA